MKRTHTAACGPLLALLCLACLLPACAGNAARQHALLPPMVKAWANIEANARAGGASAEAIAAFGQALHADDRVAIVSQWPALHAAARAGIDARVESEVIGPTVGQILHERITQFDRGVAELAPAPGNPESPGIPSGP